MYMLAEYGTFKMANNIAFNKLNAPDLGMIVAVSYTHLDVYKRQHQVDTSIPSRRF